MNDEDKKKTDQSWLPGPRGNMLKAVSFCFRYEMPQYGSRRRLLPPAGPEEYGEVVGEAEEEYEQEEVMPYCLTLF